MNYYLTHHLSPVVTLPVEVIKLLSKKAIVLDVGCGNGALKKVLPHQSLYGVDALADSVSMARKSGYIQAKRVDLNRQKLPFKSRVFNLVICRQVLEHLLFPLNTTKEIHRVLKKNCCLFVSVPTRDNKKFDDDYTHVRPFSIHSLTTMLYDSGFTQVIPIYAPKGITGLGILAKLFNCNFESITKMLANWLPWLRESTNIEVIATK